MTGTATYTGHAIANIANPNNITSYLAAGAFSATANFATRTGTVNITGLDGTNYAGTAAQVGQTATFNGSSDRQQFRPDRNARRLVLPGRPDQHDSAYGEVGGSLISERNRRLPRQRNFLPGAVNARNATLMRRPERRFVVRLESDPLRV